MGKIKRELGVDAVILQTRQFKEGGFFGLFGKVKVEITAAIEDQPLKPKVLPPQMNPYIQTQAPAVPASKVQILAQTLQEKAGTLPLDRLQDTPVNRSPVDPEDSGNLVEKKNTGGFYPEREDMHRLLRLIEGQIGMLAGDKLQVPPLLKGQAEYLTSRGVSPALTQKLIGELQHQVAARDWNNFSLVQEFFEEAVKKMCLSTATIEVKEGRPQLVALIGPTGVGKTTTIGKLAAGFSIVDKRKVALITADTYRVAAVEQLKTFGEIIGVPVEVVMTPTLLQDAINRHRDKELIFLDTAGRSPNHEVHMEELAAFLDRAKPDYTVLVLSATTQPADQLKILERFQPVTTHLLLTKLDETSNWGALLDLLQESRLPLTYLTNGQNVPDDIEAATPERLVRYILGENDHD